jgi:hypothetical protein
MSSTCNRDAAGLSAGAASWQEPRGKRRTLISVGVRERRGDAWAVLAEHETEPSLQQRFEATEVGRGLLIAFIFFLLAILLISNLPAQSEAYQQLQPRVNPVLEVTGLKQTWHLFAPTPRRRTKWLEAYVTYRDGTTVQWRQPESDPFIGTYRSSRWRKWASNVTLDGNRHLWPPTARWIARTSRRDGEWPARVVLTRRIYEFAGLGRGGEPEWNEETLIVMTFAPDGTERRS